MSRLPCRSESLTWLSAENFTCAALAGRSNDLAEEVCAFRSVPQIQSGVGPSANRLAHTACAVRRRGRREALGRGIADDRRGHGWLLGENVFTRRDGTERRGEQNQEPKCAWI